MNKEKIDQILNSYNSKDLVPSAKAWELWQESFFNKINLKQKDLIFIKRLREFKKENKFQEKDFKEKFPELKFKNYINPLSFNSYYLSEKEISRIAFSIQNETNIDWNTCLLITEYVFRGKEWNYQGFQKILDTFNIAA